MADKGSLIFSRAALLSFLPARGLDWPGKHLLHYSKWVVFALHQQGKIINKEFILRTVRRQGRGGLQLNRCLHECYKRGNHVGSNYSDLHSR